MNFKSMLLMIAAVLLLVSPALSKEIEKTSNHVNFGFQVTRDAESFEGDFPPAGYTIASPSGHSGEESWYQKTVSAYDGDKCASVNYDADLVDQDCQLSFDVDVSAGMDHLGFFAAASHYWMVSNYQNYDLNVLINGTQVWNMAAVYEGPNWTYQEAIIDLTAHIGETVTVTFQYTGNDGAALYLDSVLINDGTSQVVVHEAPENNTCSGAIALVSGTNDLAGDLTYATNDFTTLGLTGCTGYNANGNDVVFSLSLAPDGSFLGVIDQVADGALYLVEDCLDPANTCVAGVDATLGNAQEVLEYTNSTDATQELFFVVDCYSGGGTYTGTATITGVVATDAVSFGSIKAMYR